MFKKSFFKCVCVIFVLFSSVDLKASEPVVLLFLWVFGTIYVQQQQIQINDQNYRNLEEKCLTARTNRPEDLQKYIEIKDSFMYKNEESYQNCFSYESKKYITQQMESKPNNLKHFNFLLNNATHHKYNKGNCKYSKKHR